MFISQRTLKTSIIPNPLNDLLDGDIYLRFLQPAFEPFLLIHSRIRNQSQYDIIFSLQFRAMDGSDFHYMNFLGESAWPQKTAIQIFAVADLPLSEHTDWDVVKIRQDSTEEIIGGIYKEPFGTWQFIAKQPKPVFYNTKPQMIFIGGIPKSGTTWIQVIMNSHPDCLSTGENNLFSWPQPDGLATLMDTAPPPYYSMAVPQSLPFRSQAAMMYAGRAERIMGQLAEAANVRVVVDKSPRNCVFISEILCTLSDVKYVHCVRHPLDIAVSRFFHERNLLLTSPDLSQLPHDAKLRNYVTHFDPANAQIGDMARSRMKCNTYGPMGPEVVEYGR